MSTPPVTQRPHRARANLLLLACAMIWGFAFVAQRIGAEHVGAFTFNASRFLVGGLSLLPVIVLLDRRAGRSRAEGVREWRATLVPGVLCGALLFGGSTLQQMGLETTTAGNAAFITGLYMVLVPIFGIALGQRTNRNTWLGIALALVGLYLLTITADFTMVIGDLLCLIGTVFWAAHILAIGRFARRVDPIRLSVVQFLATALYSTAGAVIAEPAPFLGVPDAVGAIAYAGIMSVGVAYTLQVLGQRDAKESHAAMILATESMWGAIGGALFLGEVMTGRGYLGAALMMAGILLSQVDPRRRDGSALPVPEPPSTALTDADAHPPAER